jgi:acetylornithine/N-succinyldiaminopimelate aminotransferase
MNQRELFFAHLAQTSPSPLALEIIQADGMLLTDRDGKKFLDLVGGISVCNLGHRHPKIIEAIRNQADQYLHLLVYGEFIQSPQVLYAKELTDHLPPSLDNVYFTNSGTEAMEGAMKLAKRATKRTEIVAFNKSYHGSTQGSLSVMGDEQWRNAFRPLLPAVQHLDFNEISSLDQITEKTACVITEAVQAERGVYPASVEWMQALRKKCDAMGAIWILDEIQTGFGRSGTLWCFQQFDVFPDILLLGKALGGGMPLGAFIANHRLMAKLTNHPSLGHITTFGGHPVSCAAGRAALRALIDEGWIEQISSKEEYFRKKLKHKKIKAFRSKGLLIALEFENFETNKKIIDQCLSNGLFVDWFLFADHCMRIAPPLIISEKEIEQACSIILEALD